MNLASISVVIPFYNEAGNILPLIGEIVQNLEKKLFYEIILVDDGSNDTTYQELYQCTKTYNHIMGVRHQRRYGQSAALRTGVQLAQNDWIVTLDGDGQNNPADILLLVKHLEKIPNPVKTVIFGNRAIRHDTWIRKIASRFANIIRKTILGDNSLDAGCSLKLFPRQGFLALPLFDHFHRFLPSLFQAHRYRVINVLVSHRPRKIGKSKYNNTKRAIEGIVDLCGVYWLKRRVVLGEAASVDKSCESIPSHHEAA